ncbi:hypothetical protein ACV56Z_00020 [Staphylococcus aureus]
MHTGFSAYTSFYADAGADTETGRYDLAWKDLCSVENVVSVEFVINYGT